MRPGSGEYAEARPRGLHPSVSTPEARAVGVRLPSPRFGALMEVQISVALIGAAAVRPAWDALALAIDFEEARKESAGIGKPGLQPSRRSRSLLCQATSLTPRWSRRITATPIGRSGSFSIGYQEEGDKPDSLDVDDRALAAVEPAKPFSVRAKALNRSQPRGDFLVLPIWTSPKATSIRLA
ncbi:hypothetical protein EDE09_111131 [Neorhizobium sp. S3-V5DH]|nr:hypothetical protein EDE09_111131 [Neorhizobium sp. S3-V5DH]